MTVKLGIGAEVDDAVSGLRRVERAAEGLGDGLKEAAGGALLTGLAVVGLDTAVGQLQRVLSQFTGALSATIENSKEMTRQVAGTAEATRKMKVAFGEAVLGGGNLEKILSIVNDTVRRLTDSFRENAEESQGQVAAALTVMLRGFNALNFAVTRGQQVFAALTHGLETLASTLEILATGFNIVTQTLKTGIIAAMEVGITTAHALVEVMADLARATGQDGAAAGLQALSDKIGEAETAMRSAREESWALTGALTDNLGRAFEDIVDNTGDFLDRLFSLESGLTSTTSIVNGYIDVLGGASEATGVLTRSTEEAAVAVNKLSLAQSAAKQAAADIVAFDEAQALKRQFIAQQALDAETAARDAAVESEQNRLIKLNEFRAAEIESAAAFEERAANKRSLIASRELEELERAKAARAEYTTAVGNSLAAVLSGQEGALSAARSLIGDTLVSEGQAAIIRGLLRAFSNPAAGAAEAALGGVAVAVGSQISGNGGGGAAAVPVTQPTAASQGFSSQTTSNSNTTNITFAPSFGLGVSRRAQARAQSDFLDTARRHGFSQGAA